MLDVVTFSANSCKQISKSRAHILCIVFSSVVKVVEYKTQD